MATKPSSGARLGPGARAADLPIDDYPPPWYATSKERDAMALSEGTTLGLVACAVVCIRAVLFVLRRRSEGDTTTPRRPVPPPPDDPRWQPSTGEPQIVGKACAHCTTSFVTARDGRACKVCGVLVHRKPCYGEHKRAAHLGGNDPYR